MPTACPPPPEHGERLLLAALDAGVTLFDTAALYGFGTNEEIVGRVLKPHRQRITLASKGGMAGVTFPDGIKRMIDGRPEAIRRAHAVHPLAAVQTEYSLWTRNPEIAVLDICRELGIAFVAFSPVARAFLSGKLLDVNTLGAKDIRRGMPRFESATYAANLRLLPAYLEVACEVGCTPAQLALAWLLHRGEDIIPIPGTTSLEHLAEDIAAADVVLSPAIMQRLDALINQNTVVGPRYSAQSQSEVDTEMF